MVLVAVVMAVDVVVMILPNQPQCMLWIVAIGPLVVVVMLHVVMGVG